MDRSTPESRAVPTRRLLPRTLSLLPRTLGLLGAALIAACATPPDRPDPEAWIPVYDQASGNGRADFVCSEPDRFVAGAAGELELLPIGDGQQRYAPPHRSPHSIALLRGIEVRDFDLECELLQSGPEEPHRDICMFFGFESPQRYYYVHLAPRPDPHAHNIFCVDEAPRVALSPVPTGGIRWGDGEWHHVRIERRVDLGTIAVYWDRQPDPILIARSPTIEWGGVGFGSFDNSGRMRKLVVRAKGSRKPATAGSPFAANTGAHR
ncbi:MAG: hypothetical protein AB8H80_02440 [Planctomycetota bacterium]